ncbi:hypothetical protein V8F20_005678 [Naviculisporaceae sp. PSN 640]
MPRKASNSVEMPPQSFHFFPLLPAELQNEIWYWAASDAISSLNDSPEVCITTPLILRPRDGDAHGTPSLPLTVDTAWPALAHACRDSRAVLIFSTPGFKLRYHQYGKSPSSSQLSDDDEDGEIDINSNIDKPSKTTKKGRMLVPYRLFNPLVDTLYWTARQSFAMTRFFLTSPGQQQLARNLRHIAVELGALYPPSEMAELFRWHTVHVRTLTLVLPGFTAAAAVGGGDGGPTASTTRTRKKAKTAPTPEVTEVDFAKHARHGRPPTRRCRLLHHVHNNANNSNKIVITTVPFRNRDLPPPSLDEFLADCKRDLEEEAVFGRTAPPPAADNLAVGTTIADEVTTWDEGTRKFKGLEVTAAVFGEWVGDSLTQGKGKAKGKETGTGTGRWEVQSRSHDRDRDDDANFNFLYISPEERRNPLKYRVIEDEQLAYGSWLPEGDWR